MFRAILRVLLLIALYFSAPRPSFWADVSTLRDPTAQEIADEECDRILKSIPMHRAETYTEFYCNASTGSNLNGGSDSGSPSMSDTSNTGTWNSSTNVYTSVSTTGAVTVGQFASIYSSGASIAAYTARVTAVSGGGGSVWSVTLSSTAKAGASPSSASTYNMQVGGAWAGPTGAVAFPFAYATATMTDASGDVPRCNFKNNATYSITAAMTHAIAGPCVFQGYSSSPGDGGKATISGPTTGASFVPLTMSGGGSSLLRDFVITNNGSSGGSSGLAITSAITVERVVATAIRGSGISVNNALNNADANAIQCEAYACNQNNAASVGGIFLGSEGRAVNCISHSNTGSNASGFIISTAGQAINCVADTNGKAGFLQSASGAVCVYIWGCTANGNTGSGIDLTAGTTGNNLIGNCVLVGNGAYGINASAGANAYTRVLNCFYYSNTSGLTNGTIDETNPTTLTGNPFVSGSTGNFALNNTSGAGAAVRAAGFGSFTQVSGDGYTATTTSFPDGGAAQVADTGGGSGGTPILSSAIIQGMGVL